MQDDQSSHKFGFISDILAYGGTGTAVLLSMWATIRRSAYRNWRSSAFAELYQERLEKEARLDNKAADFAEKYSGIISDYTKDIDKRYEMLGVRKTIVGGSLDKFRKCLSTYEQARVAVLGLTVASVGLGAYLNLRNKHAILEQLKRVDTQRNDVQTTER